MTARLNQGFGKDLPVLFEGVEFDNAQSNTLEIWNVYDRGAKEEFKRWKLSAAPGTAVLGRANYTLNVRDGKLFTNDDGTKLRQERPGLFEIVSNLAAGGAVKIETTEVVDDPYGDAALSRKQKLAPSQEWNRALVKMREHEINNKSNPRFELAGITFYPTWELGVMAYYRGIFKPKNDSDIPRETIDNALAFITRGNTTVDYEAYRKILREYYDGAYKPTPLQTLADKFDQLTGYGVVDDFETIDNFAELL